MSSEDWIATRVSEAIGTAPRHPFHRAASARGLLAAGERGRWADKEWAPQL